MGSQQSHVHHYVARWYQRRFLKPSQSKFCYLDLHPGIVYSNGIRHERKSLLHWGPDLCFYKDDLYTLNVGTLSSDAIEKRFFGAIDDRGQKAVREFANYEGIRSIEGPDSFRDLVMYMDAQRFRTPRGLAWMRKRLRLPDHNRTLVLMQQLFQLNTTMWAEGIWEIVRAHNSPTKFIITDDPVTFFNRRGFPRAMPYPEDVGLEFAGTRTIFPLSLDACLIITHLQLTRDPGLNPLALRPNARSYQDALKSMLDIQFGRELEEDDVLRINLILKKRTARYVAAAEEEWLYPERRISAGWARLDDDWFLFPNLWKVPFATKMIVGWNNRPPWVFDAHGRTPAHRQYGDSLQHDRDWNTRFDAQREWAKRRAGRSLAHVDNHSREDEVADKIMNDYLSGKAEVA